MPIMAGDRGIKLSSPTQYDYYSIIIHKSYVLFGGDNFLADSADIMKEN